MNRPKKENYEEWPFEMPYEYVTNLEKYCDELERLLEGHELLVGKADEMYLKIKELDKALDKACAELSMNEEVMTLDNAYHKPSEWKARFLND